MPDALTPAEYESLAEAELRAASRSTDFERRKAHLNQAAVYATLAEAARRTRTDND